MATKRQAKQPSDEEVSAMAQVPCACVDFQDSERRAVAVDPELKRSNLIRLRRIEGQIRGLARMVESERYCADIVVQIASVQEALRGVSRTLMRNHLRHCATEAIRSGDETKAALQHEELLDLIYRHLR